jgi:hypothetical protein
MKRTLLLCAIAAAMAATFAACGGGEQGEYIVEQEENKEEENKEQQIQWQVQDTSKYPLIKRVMHYYSSDTSGREVITYQYSDGKISSESFIYERKIRDTGEWYQYYKVHDTYYGGYSRYFIKYTYLKDTVTCVEKDGEFSGLGLHKTTYYYLNKDGLATRYKVVVPKGSLYYWDYIYFGNSKNLEFSYDSDSRNITLFKWENGNIVSTIDYDYSAVRYWLGGIADMSDYDYDYYADHVNNTYFLDNKIFLGRESEYLISKFGNGVFTYEWNDRGFVSKRTYQYSDDTTVTFYEYY